MNKKTTTLLLLAIFAVALFFRLYGLKEQGIFFGDEGAMIYRASMIHEYINPDKPPVNFIFAYIDTKILWVTLVWITQLIIPGLIYPAQILSVLFGLLSIGMTYAFAQRYYDSRPIGLLSAFLLAISPYHIFYSRLAMPETAGMFCVMLSLYLYLFSIRNKKFYVLGSGLLSSFAFLMNRFRVGLLPLFALTLELTERWQNPEQFKKSWWRYILYIVITTMCIAGGVELLYRVFELGGVNFASYWEGLEGYVQQHTSSGYWDWLTSLTFPFFIIQIEGHLYCALLIMSLFFLKQKQSLLLPVVLVGLQVVVSTCMDERAARSLSPVLPLMALIGGGTLYHMACTLKENIFQKVMYAGFVGVLLVTLIVKSVMVLSYRSDMKEAMSFVHTQEGFKGLVTTNFLVSLVYSDPSKIVFFRFERLKEVVQMYQGGYNYLLMDPTKLDHRDKSSKEIKLTPAMAAIDQQCTPLATFDHWSIPLQKRLFLETKDDVLVTLALLEKVNKSTGAINVYHLGQCLEQISALD